MIIILPPQIQNKIIQPIIFKYEEVWLPLNYSIHPDIRRIYYVSNYGRVFSTSHNIFLKKELTNAGYYRVNLIRISNVNKPQHYSIHRLVLETFNPIENMENLIVNHIDGNKTNNILTNLEWTNAQMNAIHAVRNNLINWQTGEQCSWSTIDLNTADKIGYYLSLNKYSFKEISDITNVNFSIVRNISDGISWREIYKKYKLWKYRARTKSHFTKEQYNILSIYIINNLSNYNNIDNYRGLCIDACNSINIIIDRDKYLELLDFIYKYNDKN